ncbi:MAG TPA: HK97-gp10 family putative phage morphogenesis protein [Chthoniobacterales bacterium]|nr:HK97-gp10 family putative phage morphogenesis protein [Chthoniobacterales bacterium]
MPGLADINGSLSHMLSGFGVNHDLQRLIAGSHAGGGVTLTVKVTGLAELEAALEQLPPMLAKKSLVDAMTEATEAFRQRAQELAPYDSQKKEGMHLVDGIKKQMRTGSHSTAGSWVHGKVALDPNVFYGRFIEFGWITANAATAVAAQPFMRPAFDGEKYRALAIVETKLASGIEAAARELHRQ